jgi:hypothetical protein
MTMHGATLQWMCRATATLLPTALLEAGRRFLTHAAHNLPPTPTTKKKKKKGCHLVKQHLQRCLLVLLGHARRLNVSFLLSTAHLSSGVRDQARAPDSPPIRPYIVSVHQSAPDPRKVGGVFRSTSAFFILSKKPARSLILKQPQKHKY